MEKLGLVEKMFKEKYRRWANDCVSDESKSFLWPDAVRYIARRNTTKDSRPVSVSLIRHWTWIDPPEQGLGKPLRLADDGTNTFYAAKISPEQLQ